MHKKPFFSSDTRLIERKQVLLRKGLKIYETCASAHTDSFFFSWKFRILNEKHPLLDAVYSTEVFCSDHTHCSSLSLGSSDVTRVPSDDWKKYLYFLLKLVT